MKRFKVSIQDAATMKSDCHENKSKNYLRKKRKNNPDILSTREQEIVRLTILGFTNMQIAEKLFISAKTVENHKANIMQKLHLNNKAELIQYGITNKYIT